MTYLIWLIFDDIISFSISIRCSTLQQEKEKKTIFHKVSIVRSGQVKFSSSSSISSVESNKSASTPTSETKLIKVADGARRCLVCHRSNDKNQTADATWLQHPMKRLPAVQSHHQSNISSVPNRIIGCYIFDSHVLIELELLLDYEILCIYKVYNLQFPSIL